MLLLRLTWIRACDSVSFFHLRCPQSVHSFIVCVYLWVCVCCASRRLLVLCFCLLLVLCICCLLALCIHLYVHVSCVPSVYLPRECACICPVYVRVVACGVCVCLCVCCSWCWSVMASNWETTVQVLSGLFAKPKLSEKLLGRPPFRFIHDIVSAVMNSPEAEPGFAQGAVLPPSWPIWGRGAVFRRVKCVCVQL
mgnify:CR=1 FL=1